MNALHLPKTIYSKLNRLNARLVFISLALMIPTLILITWITLRNTEDVRTGRLNEKQNELDIAVSQMDLTLDILDASVVNFVAGNSDFRLIASAPEQNTEFWLMNERLYQQIGRLRDFASLDLHMSVCFPSQDLFYNREADPGLTRKITAVITGREPGYEFNRWLVLWSGGQPYLGRIYDFTDYYVTCCISLESLLDNIGLTENVEEKYWLTDPRMHILNISESSDITVNGLLAHHGKENWQTISSLSAQTGYRICAFLRTESLEQPMSPASFQIMLIIGAVLLLCAFYILGVYAWVAKPIRNLQGSMEIIKQGNMKYRIKDDPYACDEFRNAAQQFNEMMDQIEHLKIAIYENELQQDKTRLQYLSQQIQPHFILNSLNTLYNYSEKDVGTTRSIIRLLSRYYRHVVNVNSSYISLREEFAHIDDYLKLQQIRYPARFSYKIVCPDSAGKLPVPPFLIESFVGNSIKYALGGKEIIQLTMRVEEAGPGNTRITVSDTGPGFTDDVLDAVSEYQKSGIVSEELGVGIRNAIDRLRLIYHGRAQITFSNEVPHGARVDILIAFSGNLKELTKEQTDENHF